MNASDITHTPFPAAGTMTDAEREELRRHGILLTSLEELYNWGRSNSIWPIQFGLACCAIEMIAAATAEIIPLSSFQDADERQAEEDHEITMMILSDPYPNYHIPATPYHPSSSSSIVISFYHFLY